MICIARNRTCLSALIMYASAVCLLPMAEPTLADDLSATEVIVNIGVRDDAKPFSYIDITRNSEKVLPGYSGYSIEVCRHVLKQMKALPRYQHITFKAVDITARDRFRLLGVKGNLFMLCGPDSINQERLADYRSSHAVFLSGMTYAYLNPRSSKFPRGNYCDNVIGVVRGTTADTQGLADIASRNLLMRFDSALDLEIFKNSERIERTRITLLDVTRNVVATTRAQLREFDNQANSLTEKSRSAKRDEVQAIEQLLEKQELGALDNALDELITAGNGLAGIIMERMGRAHRDINAQTAKEIVTAECPGGFSAMPVRKFEHHDKGIEAFCKGEVLYYLADYDILKHKTKEVADCDIVMNRFTRSREVYGVYFPRQDVFDARANNEPETEGLHLINVASFYADFNHFLLMAMQGNESDLERIFAKEFGVQEKSEELQRFFDAFKINTP